MPLTRSLMRARQSTADTSAWRRRSQPKASRSLLLGAATNWAAFAATLVVSFFLAPYLIQHLGDARYGVWCVVESILAYFTLFDLGIAACLVRYVAKFHTTNERTELNRLVSACLVIFAIAAVAVLLLGSALVPFVAPGLERKLGEPGDRCRVFAGTQQRRSYAHARPGRMHEKRTDARGIDAWIEPLCSIHGIMDLRGVADAATE